MIAAETQERFVQRVRMAAIAHVSEGLYLNDDIDVAARTVGESLMVQIKAHVLAIPKERIVVNQSWPKDWWQAVRERWCPQWWLRRYPVQYNRVYVNKPIFGNVCPHVSMTRGDDHKEWLFKNQGDRV